MKRILRKIKNRLLKSRAPAWGLAHLKEISDLRARKHLLEFLASDGALHFQCSESPVVSVVIPVFNRAELTLQCLRSLLQFDYLGLEVIVVNNASTDETSALLPRCKGVSEIHNTNRFHYLESCNQGARVARGEYLLFLNNDTEVMPGALEAALAVFVSHSKCGAVGAKLILPDGSLQEAGSLVWQNGICAGYGRGHDPLEAPFQYERVVDYCSGAFLLTPRDLFLSLGCFDEAFKPAYYEEVDYCLRLAASGHRVVYDPRVVVHHYEFASASSAEDAIRLQHERRELLVDKHRSALALRPLPSPETVITGRSPDAQRRVLFIDERLPHIRYGAGYPRSNALVRALVDLGHFVTVYPALYVEEERWDEVYREIPRSVEVMTGAGWGPAHLTRFLTERRGYYDKIIISRPTTMKIVRDIVAGHPNLIDFSEVIYDGEAIFTHREQLEREYQGKPMSEGEFRRNLERELSLAAGVSHISTVSELEAARFRDHGGAKVTVLSHAVPLRERPPGMKERRGLLFVGSFHGDGGPNYDSMVWFCEEVLPGLRRSGFKEPLFIVGYNRSTGLRRFESLGVEIVGEVPSIAPWYDRARLFVAPTRFSAGIPLKVVEAAAAGIPCIVSPLLQEQLAWPQGGLRICKTPQEWVDAIVHLAADEEGALALQAKGRGIVGDLFSHEYFTRTLSSILEFPTDSEREEVCLKSA